MGKPMISEKKNHALSSGGLFFKKIDKQIKQSHLNSFKSFFLFRVRDFICELQFAF